LQAWALAGSGILRAAPDQIPALRQAPVPGPGTTLPPGFLKHADDQTVVGIGAVFRALHDSSALAARQLTDWGVVAGSRFLGRATLALALQRFALEGAWGVSPHLIPHRSLHSISGTVSQALGIHGPNFGAGGGPTCASEAILAAAALLSEGRVPGVWVVLTGWDPEPILERPGLAGSNGHRPSVSRCTGAALALTSLELDWGGPRLCLSLGANPKTNGRSRVPAALLPTFTVEAVVDFLERPARAPGSWNLGAGGWVEWERAGTEAENKL
jgi:hypothetical protein